VTFEVRESAGVSATVSSFALTFAFPEGGGGVANFTGDEGMVQAHVPASGVVRSKRLTISSSRPSQSTQVTIVVTYADDKNNTGTAQATASITPLPVTQPPSCTLPGVASNLSARVSGSTVDFSWSAVIGANDYLLEIGTSSGSANVDTKTVSGTSFSWPSVPNNTYYARVKARNGCGTGNASNQVTFTISSGGGSMTCSSVPGSVECGTPTARCADNSYSCSQNRQGTCSTHGGVSCWVCPGVLCNGLVAVSATAQAEECSVMKETPEQWLEGLRKRL
jgi:hypothetical protein